MIPQAGVRAPDDLAARFSSVLNGLDGRRVGADALFESLKLEALDWGMDHGVETRLLDTAEQKVTVDGDRR